MFSSADLQEIQSSARLNHGEIAVYTHVKTSDGMSDDKLRILLYIAEECARQHSGEQSVVWMATAWNIAALRGSTALTAAFIESIGKVIEPERNRYGFRQVRIGVMNQGIWIEKAPWQSVPRHLVTLVESYNDGTISDAFEMGAGNKLSTCPEHEFYRHFEEIHPFVDGNGRTGKILLNYLLGTLDKPVMPPNFWNTEAP